MRPVCGHSGCECLADGAGEVPFTLQTFGVFAALGLLGGKRGTIAIALYLVLGAVGLPVFSGFRGGFGVLLGTTGGYIFGFLLSGLLYWALTALLGNKGWVRLLAMVLGLLLCYAAGTGWFLLVYLQKPAQSLWVWCWPNALSLSCCRTQSNSP
ncbi:MAG: biotin transporter BioY [Oscillospiraceae bacterium]